MNIATMGRREAVRVLAAALCSSLFAGQFTADAATSCPAWVDSELASALKSLDARDLPPANDQVLEVWSMVEKGDEAALRRLVSADYESGRVVNVGGWWVSATEVRMLVAIRARC